MKTIDSIIIHCSATRAGQDLRAKDIDRIHKQRGFSQIGYNFVIDLDGTVENGRPLSIDGAHCNTKGFSGGAYNKHSIGICYIGGLDANGRPKDTRTEAQKSALRNLVAKLCKEYDIVELLGHRDTSPDLNGNGEVEPAEYIKACPCFDVRSEFSNFLRNTVVKP
ncbi:N-acetylmuramoyl-L-alanine amidase [Bacteroides nordii]|uniref:N-acetylmuramoyl-L-alanine amidase n=1 Tax=Bacteroides nordii TaxID=291645 RepID=UPI00203B51A1|nr:N-acetylmuramoyl-L-alanine amidase [Bacteroides nordii]GFZ38949.1 N-acetylmuramoyl-L-alanine amidase [Bacteroides nordii]